MGDGLTPKDREMLNVELARTGCSGQSYGRESSDSGVGPTFLIYYAPALLQKNSQTNACGALVVLAEVLCQARQLWPLQENCGNDTVTLRIDAVKEADLKQLQESE